MIFQCNHYLRKIVLFDVAATQSWSLPNNELENLVSDHQLIIIVYLPKSNFINIGPVVLQCIQCEQTFLLLYCYMVICQFVFICKEEFEFSYMFTFPDLKLAPSS